MIVCHEYRYIFLKTNKTAGTSVEIALSTHCSDRDIITPMSDEGLRKQCGGHGPANYLAPWRDYAVKDWRRFLLNGRRKLRFHNHMPASEARPYLGEEIWNSYFKFCFERNPWDRVVSYYFWHFRGREAPPISEFIHSGRLQSLKKRGFGLYTIDNEIVVDRVCRFENLQDDLNQVGVRLQLPGPLDLPNAKSGTRKEKKHYSEILTDADRQHIAGLFADEIKLFGYSY